MPLRITLLSILSLLSTASFCQKTVADSLQTLILSVPADTGKVYLLNNLVLELREKDNRKALVYAREAKELAELLNYQTGLLKALDNYAWLLYRNGDFSKSLEMSGEAKRLAEKLKDWKELSSILISIAAIHYEQKKFQPAIDHFRQAFRMSLRLGDTLTMSRCYNNIAYSYYGLKDIDSTEYYAYKALALARTAREKYMEAFAYRTLGDVFVERKQFSKANDVLMNCYHLSLELGNNFLRTSVLHRLARNAHAEGKYDEAINYLNENISIAEKFGFKNELERGYKLMSELHYKQNDLRNAYHYQSLYTSVHDSLYNQRSAEQIALMQSKYDNDLKQAQIEILTRDAALKSEDIEQQRIWIYFFAGSFTLLLVLAIVLYQNNRHNRKARISLQEKNREIQSQTRQLKNLNTTKDKLFSIISHDLRSPVASLKALMEIVSTAGLSQDEFIDITKVLKRNLDAVYDDLDNLLFWAQTQLRGLQVVPEPIDLRKVAEDKIEFFGEQLSHKNITVLNEIPPGITVVADPNHLSLVFRNLLANAIKFNKERGNIELSCVEQNGFYEVSVSDSGVGLDKDDIVKLFNAETHFTKPGTRQEKGVGIGLLLTKEFVEKNEGSIWVSSEPGKGATFTFTIKANKQMEFLPLTN